MDRGPPRHMRCEQMTRKAFARRLHSDGPSLGSCSLAKTLMLPQAREVAMVRSRSRSRSRKQNELEAKETAALVRR